ncbi:MAG: cupin domain-containing protein [Labilithrix sp.]|nr:cupin domain-containing protein [Labilithrix sp.]
MQPDLPVEALLATLAPEAARLVALLGLAPHPEGGWFRETWRSPLALGSLPHGAPRSASTAIYFLLPAGTFSALHRVASDEAWHHYDGDPVELHVLEGRVHQTFVLGRDLAAGQRPQHVVPAGAWQAAVPLGERWALCGCTVAPGFDFADFEMPSREEMLRLLPDHAAVVERLTRSAAPPAEPADRR